LFPPLSDAATGASIHERVRDYYDATTERSFLKTWTPEGAGIHFGLSGEGVETHAQSLEHTNRTLVDALGVSAGDRCLDAGCGVGGTALWVVRERGAEVLGVTLSARQVELAEGFARAQGAEARARFRVANYAATGFDPGSFDVIWTLESFCHAPDPTETLRHFFALLRPGGRFGCMDLFRGAQGDPRHVEELCAGWVLPEFLTAEGTAAELTRVGFEDVRGVDLTPKVLRSAATLLDVASLNLKKLQFERILDAPPDPVMEGHVRGALGCARGFFDGAVTYNLVLGTKPRGGP
jgi:ubiquinone/menaquinone biosynthesis C-methylase UbiE